MQPTLARRARDDCSIRQIHSLVTLRLGRSSTQCARSQLKRNTTLVEASDAEINSGCLNGGRCGQAVMGRRITHLTGSALVSSRRKRITSRGCNLAARKGVQMMWTRQQLTRSFLRFGGASDFLIAQHERGSGLSPNTNRGGPLSSAARIKLESVIP